MEGLEDCIKYFYSLIECSVEYLRVLVIETLLAILSEFACFLGELDEFD
jgi:hypothetical protein